MWLLNKNTWRSLHPTFHVKLNSISSLLSQVLAFAVCERVCIHTQRLAESVVVKTWARAEEGSQPLDRLCSRAKPKLGLSRFNVLLKESLFVFIIDLSFYFLL